MCKHEEKNCPGCNIRFECKPGDIAHCQCYGVVLTAEQRVWIEESYDDCLCRTCLEHLQQTVEGSKALTVQDV